MQFLTSDGRKSLSCHSCKLSLLFPICISQHKYVWSWRAEVIKAFKEVFQGTEGMVQKWEIIKLALMSRKATLDHVLLLQQKDEWIQKLTHHSFTSAAWGINRKCTKTGSSLLELGLYHTALQGRLRQIISRSLRCWTPAVWWLPSAPAWGMSA